MNQPATQTLFLSRLVLDGRSRRARKLLADPSALYGELLNAFPGAIAHHGGAAPADRRGLLFRIEPELANQPPTLLVQSAEAPDWSLLQGQGERLFDLRRPPETKPLHPNLEPGDILAFRLRANPTKSIPGEEISPGVRKRGTPRPLIAEQDQRTWLAARLADVAAIADLRVVDEGTRRYRRGPGTKPAEFLSILFDGLLRIEDPEALRQLLLAGVGRGKGFGFGLLSIRRA